jgi:hypothetical protein
MNLEATADELYGLHPTQFTRARDAFVAAARKEGDRATADALKLLRRPSLGAWLANRIVRDRPRDLDHLLTVAAELREAQERLDGETMRRLSREGRDVVEVLVRDAPIVVPAGQGVSQAAVEDLEATLDAALGDPDAAETLRRGRLTSALRYSGLGLDGAASAPGGGDTAGTVSPSKRASTDREMKKARDDLERVRAQLQDAETAVAAAEATLAERKHVARRAARRVRDAEKTLQNSERKAASRAGRRS